MSGKGKGQLIKIWKLECGGIQRGEQKSGVLFIGEVPRGCNFLSSPHSLRMLKSLELLGFIIMRSKITSSKKLSYFRTLLFVCSSLCCNCNWPSGC